MSTYIIHLENEVLGDRGWDGYITDKLCSTPEV